MRSFPLTLSLFLLASAGTTSSQTIRELLSTDPAPQELGFHDVAGEAHLPALPDQEPEPLVGETNALQVLTRARALHLSADSATDAWRVSEETFQLAGLRMAAPLPPNPVIFKGRKVSKLNVLLRKPGTAAVVVTSPELLLDQPIHIVRVGLSLDLGQTQLQPGDPGSAAPYAIRIENASEIRLSGGTITTGRWGVLVARSHGITITGMNLHDLTGGGILVTTSSNVVLWNNRLHALRAAAVLVHGDTDHITVAHNEIFGNLGASNWHAGVVLTDRTADLATDPGNLLAPGNYWPRPQPIVERLLSPHDNVVAQNRIVDNAGSGIYSDGSTRNVFVQNDIERNSKEGLCLDYGSTSDVVAWNLFRANGKRWGKSDDDLKNDFVFGLGRLPDGSSPAKVPAISLDNAAWNQVVYNQIDGNFGGGVKMVRTSVFNLIGLNLLTDNNAGRSESFHFFGVELGAAPADAPSQELDFTPSRGNEIFGNNIRGPHYAGIFFAEGSDRNNVFDNSVFGATDWAMESVRAQPNTTLNNLTNLKLRNISSGLDPALLTLGRGVFDTPPTPVHTNPVTPARGPGAAAPPTPGAIKP